MGTVCLTGSLLGLSLTARAGNDNARINADGTVDFEVHYTYAPTQDDVDEMESIIRSASEIMCDTTDGDIRFGRVVVTSGSGAESLADVRLMPPGAWSRSSSNGFILYDTPTVYLTQSGRNNATFAHEMGHAVLSLPDAYDEQRRYGRYDGIGYAIDPGACSVTLRACVEDADCFSLETCDRPGYLPMGVPTMDDTSNTLMGGVIALSLVSRCAIGNNPCPSGNMDCTAFPMDRCQPSPYYSELLTLANYDVYAGSGSGCPNPNPGRGVKMFGWVGENLPVRMFDPSTIASAQMTAAAFVTFEYIDAYGELTGEDVASDHTIFVFFEHVDIAAREWRVWVEMDGGEFDGGTPDTGQVLGTFDIDFNGMATTNPTTGFLAQSVRVHNGSTYVSPTDPAYVEPTYSVPKLETGAPGTIQRLDLSELVEASGIASSNFTGRSTITANGLPQTGFCGLSKLGTETAADDFCDAVPPTECDGRWNATSGRWEAAELTFRGLQGKPSFNSEWDSIANLPNKFGSNVFSPAERFNAPIFPPSVLPDPISPECAGSGDVVDVDIQVSGSDSIVLLIDTSESMLEELSPAGQAGTRLGWAKSAATQIAQAIQSSNLTGTATTQQLGVVAFGEGVNVIVPPTPVGLPGELTATAIADLIGDIESAGPTPLADGIVEASALALGASNLLTPSVVVFTDGKANVCAGGVRLAFDGCFFPDPTDQAVAVLEEFSNPDPGSNAKAVQYFYVPLGAQLGEGIFGSAIQDTGGDVIVSETGRELPMSFLSANIKTSGQAPVLGVNRWDVAGSAGFPPQLEPSETRFFHVDEGASKLRLSLSSLNPEISTWNPGFELRGPGGIVLRRDDPGISVVDDPLDNLFEFMEVDAPASGDWELELFSADALPQSGYAVAWVDSAEPDCFASSDVPIVDAGAGPISFSAISSWRTPVEGVVYTARVTRPDGSTFTVPMDQTLDSGRYAGEFADYSGQGLYKLDVECNAQVASYVYGENVADQEDRPPATDSPSFTRVASTTFVVHSVQFQPLPEGDDCDGDGYSNEQEGAFCAGGGSTGPCPVDSGASSDTDGDGTIDACDSDSDADDVPDSDEPIGDADGDGLPNRADYDSDGDGIIDVQDDVPYVVSDPGARCRESRRLLGTASVSILINRAEDALDPLLDSVAMERQLLLELAVASHPAALLRAALHFELVASDLISQSLEQGVPVWRRNLLQKLALASLQAARLLKEAACDHC